MRYIKFILLHLLLDIFFTVGMVFIYIKGSEGSILIRDFPILVIVIAIILIGIKNFGSRPTFGIIGEVAITIAFYLWYMESTKDAYDILASNIWFVNIIRGLILLAGFYFILDVIKRYLNAFIKSAQIFYTANSKEDFSILECFIGATLRFKHTLAIPLFNKIVRNCADEIVEGIKKIDNEPDGKVDEFLENLKDTKVVKASKWMLKKYTDYIDECVLVYCYVHPEKSMLRSTLEAISIFLKNGFKIIEQMAVVIILQVLLRIALTAVIIIALVSMANLTVTKILIGFIVIKIAEFIIQDALIEPLLMQKILNVFVKQEAELNSARSLLEKFPILNKIRGLQNSKEPDDTDDPVTTQEVDSQEEKPEESIKSDVHQTTEESKAESETVRESIKDAFEREKEQRERETIL